MNKKTVIIINPISLDIMKAIYNMIISNLLNIIIYGNRDIIDNLCNQLNFNINLLQIIDCNNDKDIYDKLLLSKDIKLDGIIYDDFKEDYISQIYPFNCLNYLIDFGIFKQSVLLIKNNNTLNDEIDLGEPINILNSLDIYNINIGLIQSNKEKIRKIRKQILKKYHITSITNISESKIKKCKCNIIYFDDIFNEIQYINKLKNMFLPRIIEIKKASNIYIFDASNQSFKNIFLQLLFISKINILNNKLNTQTI